MHALGAVEEVPILVRKLLRVSSTAGIRVAELGRRLLKILLMLFHKAVFFEELELEDSHSFFQDVDVGENQDLDGYQEIAQDHKVVGGFKHLWLVELKYSCHIYIIIHLT